MINGISSLYFNSFVGVRQGENLSPLLLFVLLVNDIGSFCLSRQCSTLKYLDIYARCNSDNIILYLFLLLYADDSNGGK